MTNTTNIYDLKAKGLKYMAGRAAISLINLFIPRRLFTSKSWFLDWERHGLHIFPTDYNSPAPVVRELTDTLWKAPSRVLGFDMRDEEQLRFLDIIASKYKSEYDRFPVRDVASTIAADEANEARKACSGYYLGNGWFEKVDGEVLYSIVREVKPERIIEVGSGYSSKVAVQAIRTNSASQPQYRCEITAIEPYANRLMAEEFPGIVNLVRRRIQEVDLELFEQLGENDILFIDSTHICKTGSDATFEICNILPRLRPGVYVHFHDIYIPYEYPRIWVVDDLTFYNEQYLLQSFLSFNNRFETIWASYYMMKTYPDELRRAFGSFDKDVLPKERFLPSSFWFRSK